MTPVKENQIIKVVETAGLEESTQLQIKEKFLPFFEKAEEWKKKAKALVVTDISQKHEMQMARQARLALRSIRIDADKVRKELKEDSLRYGKAVQGVYNVIEYLIKPIERHLEEQEKFAEIQEAKRKDEIRQYRKAEIEPYAEFLPFGLDFGEMSETDYNNVLSGAKLQQQQKIEDERKAEQERIEREKAEAEERERIRKENERLKAEAEKRELELEAERKKREEELRLEREKAEKERQKAEAERKAKEEKERIEREKIEAKLRSEAEEKARLEAEIKAKEEAERKRKQEEEMRAAEEGRQKKEAERKARLAPDKQKLLELANQVDLIEMPSVKSREAKKVLEDVKTLLAKTSSFIREKSTKL